MKAILERIAGQETDWRFRRRKDHSFCAPAL
jgi:hypothetical protein